MDTIGLDLHKRETQLCILSPDGTAKEGRQAPSTGRIGDPRLSTSPGRSHPPRTPKPNATTWRSSPCSGAAPLRFV